MSWRDKGPPKREPGPLDKGTGSQRLELSSNQVHLSAEGRRCAASQQVSWWAVHEYVAPLLDEVGDWPMVGTPAWCALADTDPRKSGALLDAAQHWALRLEAAQVARAEASRAVAGAADWAQAAAETYQRSTSNRIPRVVV